MDHQLAQVASDVRRYQYSMRRMRRNYAEFISAYRTCLMALARASERESMSLIIAVATKFWDFYDSAYEAGFRRTVGDKSSHLERAVTVFNRRRDELIELQYKLRGQRSRFTARL